MKHDPEEFVLVVDDDRSALESLSEVLEMEGYNILRASSGREAVERIRVGEPLDLVLTDLRMKDLDGLGVLEAVKASGRDVPVILMTAFASLETTIEAIQRGAYDYLSKPFKLDQLRVVVRRALEQSLLKRENRRLKAIDKEAREETDVIGRSPEMVEVYKLIAKVAPLSTTILIQGESGSGKEVAARLVHRISARSGGPFKAINCGALPETLLESELFGYQKGAFTGANTNKAGLFEAADHGTCFLDEIANTSPALQMKLLRVLEEKEVTRLGSTETVKVDVRILAAANQPLEELVKSGAFREDLFYRLKVVTLSIPPLRQRRGDIPLLLEYFLRRHAVLSGKTVAVHEAVYPMLSRHAWPGNVRELENAVERAVALNASGILTPEDFPEEIRQDAATPPVGPFPLVSFKTLAEKEQEYLQEVLAATGGNASRTAEILNIDRRTLYRMLERFGVQR